MQNIHQHFATTVPRPHFQNEIRAKFLFERENNDSKSFLTSGEARILWIKVTFLKNIRLHTIFSIWEFVFLSAFYYQDIARDYCLKSSSKYFGKNSKRFAVESSI